MGTAGPSGFHSANTHGDPREKAGQIHRLGARGSTDRERKSRGGRGDGRHRKKNRRKKKKQEKNKKQGKRPQRERCLWKFCLPITYTGPFSPGHSHPPRMTIAKLRWLTLVLCPFKYLYQEKRRYTIKHTLSFLFKLKI